MSASELGVGLLRRLPAETAHRLTLKLTRAAAALRPDPPADDPRLGIALFGRHFPNPVGLAAGFDKNAEVPAAMARFGFGFVECGTVTPRPQAGNPKPRLFRLGKDDAVINRMGFNNLGMKAVARNLSRRKGGGIVGINVGANKDSTDRVADYLLAFDLLGPLADYVAINVSSPNTPGLRGLQNRDELARLLGALVDKRTQRSIEVPLLLKIAPDLDEQALDDIATVVLASGIEGLIVSNTTLARPPLRSLHASQTGGLSGKPLFALSTTILKAMHDRLGRRIVLVGVGGIGSGADAYAKIRAGASLVQLYTALVYAGPGLVARINRELAEYLARDGFAQLADAVGSGES
ncbi:MAG TPA: quinone-dependent dihydroorotate dehydrogenase [Rhizomicrobium sp.]|jgi:dihydroorotate dehydrogenase|nr:quinone-dependent dihydroorotate dehydrogenase [Rhizomicrobium sp.]